MAAGVALLLSTFAMPVRVWRTGELPVPPLALAPAGSEALGAGRLWIDSDAACGAGARVDPDDCFALLLFAAAAPARIVGISAVRGNASHDVVEATVREFLLQARRDGAPALPLYPTADAPAALRRALGQVRLTIVALGPLTNIAAALRDRPDLAARVERLVVVMGRRQGHLFHPSEGRAHGMLLGHGPVFSDFNYAQDRRAAEAVMRLAVPITMVPYEAAREVLLTRADVDSLARSGGASAWAAVRARAWLAYWREQIGLDGFYPFDLLAAAFVLHPSFFDCAAVRAWISPSALPAWLGFGDALYVGLRSEQPADARAARGVTYCPRVRAGLRDWMLRQLRPARE
jgi:inosine-uridine nucleoside N-ribohydrolase